MKRLFWVVLGMVLISCNKENERILTFSFGAETSFIQEADYSSEDRTLEIEVEVISDSRCPLNAQCVWQGEAEVKVEIENGITSEVILSTYDNHVDTVRNTRLELISVDPYPEQDKNIPLSSKIVTLVIEVVKS